jgi:hypothetical protein
MGESPIGPQGHARRPAQSIIGVPACVLDCCQGLRSHVSLGQTRFPPVRKNIGTADFVPGNDRIVPPGRTSEYRSTRMLECLSA